MFDKNEIDLMREIGLNFDFNNLTDDQLVEIEDKVSDELTLHCLDDKYNPNKRGLICESILNHLDD